MFPVEGVKLACERLTICRAVGVAILLCFGGVALITQPKFLGFPDNGRITALGAFFALFQVRKPWPSLPLSVLRLLYDHSSVKGL